LIEVAQNNCKQTLTHPMIALSEPLKSGFVDKVKLALREHFSGVLMRGSVNEGAVTEGFSVLS